MRRSNQKRVQSLFDNGCFKIFSIAFHARHHFHGRPQRRKRCHEIIANKFSLKFSTYLIFSCTVLLLIRFVHDTIFFPPRTVILLLLFRKKNCAVNEHYYLRCAYEEHFFEKKNPACHPQLPVLMKCFSTTTFAFRPKYSPTLTRCFSITRFTLHPKYYSRCPAEILF